MLVFFSIVLALLVTGATVYGLHRYQAMEVEYTVDRTMPLPPLHEEFQAGISARSSNKPQADIPIQERKNSEAERAASTQPGPASGPKSSAWQARVNAAKKSGNLDLAYQICVDNYPLWGAYNQACIILRSRLKSVKLSRAERETLLGELYRCAVVAELMHDKSYGAEHRTLNQLKQMPLTMLAEQEFDYSAIGYAELRLIRKSDVKLLQTHWGRPETHQLPRQAVPDLWQTLTQKQPA